VELAVSSQPAKAVAPVRARVRATGVLRECYRGALDRIFANVPGRNPGRGELLWLRGCPELQLVHGHERVEERRPGVLQFDAIGMGPQLGQPPASRDLGPAGLLTVATNANKYKLFGAYAGTAWQKWSGE
jgi:hypothetical protein